MAIEIRQFACVIPANTLITAPVVVDCSFPPRVVTEIEIVVPPGPSGNVGFAISCSGQNMIPFNAGAWIVTDNEKINWPMDEQITSGAWELQGYNSGQFPHTIYVRFLLDLVQPADTGTTTTVISDDSLSGTVAS